MSVSYLYEFNAELVRLVYGYTNCLGLVPLFRIALP